MKNRKQLLSERLRIESALHEVGSLGKRFRDIEYPRWIKDLRKQLQMSQKQLAKRAKITQPQLSQIEAGKAKITLETLQKVFEALFCEVLLLPLVQGSMKEIVKKQAKLAAKKKLASLMGSMALEEQLPSRDYLESKIEEVAEDLIRSGSTEIWDT